MQSEVDGVGRAVWGAQVDDLGLLAGLEDHLHLVQNVASFSRCVCVKAVVGVSQSSISAIEQCAGHLACDPRCSNAGTLLNELAGSNIKSNPL